LSGALSADDKESARRPIFDSGLTGFYLVEVARVLKKYALKKRGAPGQ
jgi:hypothetical protein